MDKGSSFISCYTRYFPSVTNRQVFNTEESPDPGETNIMITNRKIFDASLDNELMLRGRPKGPLSKPNGGGYSLRVTLGWDDQKYRQVQVSKITIFDFND